MNIAVIAANGRSGKIFVERALAAGHSVRAGVHSHNNLDPHPQLSVVTCDATKQEDLGALIDNQDAVVSFIGHVKGSPAQVQTDAMRQLTIAMSQRGMRRVVSLTGTGVRFAGDRITLVDRILNAGIAVVDPKRIRDGKDHVEILKQSSLDWTVIRVLKLKNTSPSPFALKQNGPTKWFVGRKDVAEAVLEVLEMNAYFTQAPIMSRAPKRT